MITYNLFDNDYLIEKFSGNVNTREFVSMKQNQIDHTDYHKIKGIVMDLRKAKISLSNEKLKQFFAWLIKNKAILENKSIAILTRSMEQLNFSYLLKDELSDNYIPVQIGQFSSQQQAYKWLKDDRRK